MLLPAINISDLPIMKQDWKITAGMEVPSDSCLQSILIYRRYASVFNAPQILCNTFVQKKKLCSESTILGLAGF